MYIILSQRKDIEMSYSDALYSVYHYPAKYKNQIHEGDVFVYYQGDRTNKEHRVYFGTGTIGNIHTNDGISYYAELINCMSFEKEISIYLDGDPKYIESFDYETVRKSPNPPWQSSIRALSEKAYNYIISHAGRLTCIRHSCTEDEYKVELKQAIKKYYLEGSVDGLIDAYSIIGKILRKQEAEDDVSTQITEYTQVRQLIDYCKSMRMTYSYKAVLILALINSKSLSVDMNEAVTFFRDFYNERRRNNQRIEKNNCLYQRIDISDDEIMHNIIRNPIQALIKSSYFQFDECTKVFSINDKLISEITEQDRDEIRKACKRKLNAYYHSIK